MSFKPIKTRKISGEIIEQIKKMILSGELKPGDKLLSERELSEELRVSRASVREALSALELMGLIEVRPGEGTHIKKASVEDIIQPLSMMLLMQKDFAEDVLEVRKILEVGCARLAAVRRTDKELEAMDQALIQMEADINNDRLGAEADMRFHYTIALASHNILLIRLMNTIADSIQENLRENREMLFNTPGTSDRLLKEHTAVYNAIKNQEPEEARNLMLQHLEMVQKEMLKEK